MSKIDNLLVKDIKMLSLDMIKEAQSGNSGLVFSSASTLYTLFMYYLKFDNNNKFWINRDRLYVNNNLLPVLYSTMHMFGFDISIDDLKEYKKLNNKVLGFLANTNINGDIIGYSTGEAFSEKYIEDIINSANSKSKFINYKTYCICTYDDIMSGISHEAIDFASLNKLNNLIIIVIKDKFGNEDLRKDTYNNNLIEYLEDFNLNVVEAKNNNIGSIKDAFDDAISSKIPSVIIIDSQNEKLLSEQNYNRMLTNEELNIIREKYGINSAFAIDESNYIETKKHISKRIDKIIAKWNEEKNKVLTNAKIKEIIEFLETREIKINFNVDNIKLNDNYEEELVIGNSKIFNIFASKSPYILSISNDNFNNTLCNIKTSKKYSKDNPLERNISVGGRTLFMGSFANGIANAGFKVFVSAPLIDSNILKPFIKYSAYRELDVHYIFTHDTFINTYNDMGIGGLDEINSFRLIPKLITFRPCDINEIIGIYNILANYKRCSISIIGSDIRGCLPTTNPKYVVAGAYRVKREKGDANGVIVATGTEVALALKIADSLLPYGIDLRVISMPSMELFQNQSEKYQYTLIPKELKTFVIEFGSTLIWEKYASGSEYILGIDRYSTSGTKEELLNKYNLDLDSIKTRIIELMKN